MLHGIITAVSVLLLLVPQEKPGERSPAGPAESQPATRPAETNTILRRPQQADILRNLLGREDRPAPIRPQDPGNPTARPGSGSVDSEGRPLLLEGSFLIERPGHLVREADRPKFVFLADADNQSALTLEILPNQLLETMEREAEAGFPEFVVSAEVTRYKGCNYLLLRKILRRVPHGNLSP